MTLILILILNYLWVVNSKVIMEVKIKNYRNLDDIKSNGVKCEIMHFWDHCDPHFDLCITAFSSCDISKGIISRWKNKKSVYQIFSKRFSLFHKPPSIDIKVTVRDEDGISHHELIGIFHHKFNSIPLNYEKQAYLEVWPNNERLKMEASVQVKCAPNYFGFQCTRYCNPVAGNFMCDMYSGEAICTLDCNYRLQYCAKIKNPSDENKFECKCKYDGEMPDCLVPQKTTTIELSTTQWKDITSTTKPTSLSTTTKPTSLSTTSIPTNLSTTSIPTSLSTTSIPTEYTSTTKQYISPITSTTTTQSTTVITTVKSHTFSPIINTSTILNTSISKHSQHINQISNKIAHNVIGTDEKSTITLTTLIIIVLLCVLCVCMFSMIFMIHSWHRRSYKIPMYEPNVLSRPLPQIYYRPGNNEEKQIAMTMSRCSSTLPDTPSSPLPYNTYTSCDYSTALIQSSSPKETRPDSIYDEPGPVEFPVESDFTCQTELPADYYANESVDSPNNPDQYVDEDFYQKPLEKPKL